MADQRLVCHLDGPCADRHEPRVGQRAEDILDVLTLLRARRELGDGDAATGVLGAVAELCQAKEDVACKCLLPGRKRVAVYRFRRFRNCSLNTAGLQITDQRQYAAAPSPPRLEQAVREERQGTWLTDDVAQDPFDEAWFENKAGVLGRTLDRLPKLLLAHRPDERLVILERRG